MEHFTIKAIVTEQQMIDICRLRYMILHNEQQKEIHYTYHKAKLVMDKLDDISFILGCYDKDILIGTARGTLFKEAGIKRLNAIYGQDILSLMPGATLENSAYASRMVVLEEYRHHHVPQFLLVGLLKYAYQNGVRYGFMSALDELVPLYKHFGANIIARGYFEDYHTEMNLLSVDIEQLQHLMKPDQVQAKQALG